ncbi:MAG: hypothetical protein EOO99_03615 [Pedobacter sp.]|nr:MAG: hypothetical protein EOO99_03615 [Pedobacter sp.]
MESKLDWGVIKELKQSIYGDAWHGPSILQQLQFVEPSFAFKYRFFPSHSIAEIVLHLVAWTEEVNSRLLGAVAKQPVLGDWPTVENSFPTLNTQPNLVWDKIKFDCQVSLSELVRVVEQLSPLDWVQPVQEELPVTQPMSKEELLYGFVQHQAYHSGQIGLLIKSFTI